MIHLALIGLLLAQEEGVTLKYGEDRSPADRIYTENTMTLDMQGTEEALGFVRTLHPFLSMQKLVVRAEGNRRITPLKLNRWTYEEARVEMKYDDEEYEYDYTRGTPAVGDEDKVLQIMWFMAAAGRTYRLSPGGEYTSSDKNQDANGEAMDLIALAVVRLPDGPVKAGEEYVRKFVGKRSEKGKTAKIHYQQRVKVDMIEEIDGKKVATLGSILTGKLVGNEDPNAEEAWTKVAGVSKTRIEVGTGRVLLSEGKGTVTAYWKGPAQDGGTNELTIKMGIAGRTKVE